MSKNTVHWISYVFVIVLCAPLAAFIHKSVIDLYISGRYAKIEDVQKLRDDVKAELIEQMMEETQQDIDYQQRMHNQAVLEDRPITVHRDELLRLRDRYADLRRVMGDIHDGN